MTGPRTLLWSKSRDAVLSDCPRRYFFQYYGWRGGDEAGAPPRTREIFLLRHVRTRYMWAGVVVHDALEGVLRGVREGRPAPALPELRERVLDRMRGDFRASRARRYRAEPSPDSVALHEHEYGRTVTDLEWRALAGQVVRCLDRFFESPRWSELRDGDPGRDWLELEELRAFDLPGVTVRVKLDFAHRDGDGITVIDWKTGRSSAGNRFQLGCYVRYAVERFGIPPSAARALEVNLATGREREHRFDEAALDRVEQAILSGAGRMRALLRDQNRDEAVEEDFPLNPGRWRCRNCSFARVCPAMSRQAAPARAAAPAHAPAAAC